MTATGPSHPFDRARILGYLWPFGSAIELIPCLPFCSSLLDRFLERLDHACVSVGRPAHCLPIFLKPYMAREPAWTYDGPEVVPSPNLSLVVAFAPFLVYP